MNKRLVCLVTLLYLCTFTTTVMAATIDTKYMHFMPVVIDGDDRDWSNVRHTIYNTRIRRQEGTLVTIKDNTFTPGNVTLKQGAVLSWNNSDDSTLNDHQIALGFEAPITFTSNSLSLGETDHVTLNDAANFTYHTSRVNFPVYPDGNVSITQSDLVNFGYGIAFASTQTQLFISFTFFNVSENGAGGAKYVRRIDIIMDDFADGVIEGEHAVQIEKQGTVYVGKDMFYDLGVLKTDTSVGESDDVNAGHLFTEPPTANSTNYNKDLFIEVEMPIGSFDLKDLGSGPGDDIGIEVIVRVSDTDQDADDSLPGVEGYYQGGGHPVLFTQSEENTLVLDMDPNAFAIVNLSGETLIEILETIFEELWIAIVGAIAGVFTFIFGFTVKARKKDSII